MIRRSFAWCVALSLVPALALAATHRIDDSTSQVSPPVADWQWQPFTARNATTQLFMDVVVRARLDTRAWEGRDGRIFMVLAPESGAGITATWQTQGTLLAGRVAAGERTLVYDGRITAPYLEDTMRVRLSTDSRFANNATRRIEFRFEIDTP